MDQKETANFLKKELGLDGIDDPDELRREIEQRVDSLNKLDRAALLMKLGARDDELSELRPSDRYSPLTWTLIVTAVMFIGASVVLFYLILATSIWVIAKVIAGIFAVVWLVAGWRGAARVVFRFKHGKDW